MNKNTFFSTALEVLVEQCNKHDRLWQVRKRMLSTWRLFRIIAVTRTENGIRSAFSVFDLSGEDTPSFPALIACKKKSAGAAFEEFWFFSINCFVKHTQVNLLGKGGGFMQLMPAK